MPHALLLSPDDQAVNAITGVLEEMSVTCERPLDGATAAQKLSSHAFDLVLVDCENLPAAKLIFDVCRRGNNGNSPVPIAIVDGRAGLPTAFRLGAELILTKPVAKDQARTTIRAAVGRVRKDATANESVAPPSPNATLTSPTIAAPRAQAAAVSSQLTNSTEIVPGVRPAAAAAASHSAVAPAPVPSVPVASAAVASAAVASAAAAPAIGGHTAATPASFASAAAALTAKMRPTIDQGEDDVEAAAALSKLKPQAAVASAEAAHLEAETTVELGEDPVMAELEQAELEESKPPDPPKEEAKPVKSAAAEATAKTAPPVLSYQKERQKPRGALVAMLVLALACAGFYAAWTYEPGFRTIAQPQIARVLALAGVALPPTSAPVPARRPVHSAPVATAAATAAGGPVVAANGAAPATQTAGAPGPGVASAAPAAISTTTPAASTTNADSNATSNGSLAGKPNVTKPGTTGNAGDRTKVADASPSDAPLPGENTAIILSSKGAEKRLERSITPKYPADAELAGAEVTVVLKAVVDANGRVEGLRLVEGNAALGAAAMQAVKQWRYRPYVRDGKTLPFQTIVIVDFQHP